VPLWSNDRDFDGTGVEQMTTTVASAESGDADMLVTTDDRMIRQAARARLDLRVRLVTPQDAVALVSRK
jgi:hypothetical protein